MRRPLLIGGGCAVVVVLVVLARLVLSDRSDARMHVYDSATRREIWNASTPGGWLAVIAVTPEAALVADADDCNDGGTGRVELLTARGRTVVAPIDGCAAYRYGIDSPVAAARIAGNRLLVVLPPALGGRTVALPCPCPTDARTPGGYPDPHEVLAYGAYVRIEPGSFHPGAD